MKFVTTISIIDESNGKYKIKIGNGKVFSVSEDELREKFGFEGESPKVGNNWNVIIIATANFQRKSLSLLESVGMGTTYQEKGCYEIFINEIYYGEDYNRFKDIKIDSESIGEEMNSLLEDVAEIPEKIQNAYNVYKRARQYFEKISKVYRGVSKFMKSPGGFILENITDGIKIVFGDTVQMFANLIQTAVDGVDVWNLMYKYDELAGDGKNAVLNKYTKVSESSSTAGYDKVITIESRKSNELEEEDRGFSKTTKIPVIPVELYGMAVGNISLLDINIFSVDASVHNTKNAPWMYIRNFAIYFMRISIYIMTAILLTMMIWHGLQTVMRSVNPTDKIKHKNGFYKIIKCIGMLISVVLVMTICIYLCETFLKIAKLDEKTKLEFPIRVVVKDKDQNDVYQFSTNITGYVRYMVEMDSVEKYGEKAFYTLMYIILAFFNLIAAGVMLVRMLFMMFLGIIGPIIVGFYAFDREKSLPIKYPAWIRLYATTASLQIVLAIIYRLILEIAI